MDQTEQEFLHDIVDAVHCPICRAKAAKMYQSPSHVEPIWACDTPDCPFNWETGPHTWTLVSTD